MYTLDLLNNIILDDIIKDAFLNNQNETQVCTSNFYKLFYNTNFFYR